MARHRHRQRKLLLAMLPTEEWLKHRAETKNLGTFEDAYSSTHAMACAIRDLITEAHLFGIAEWVLVLYQGKPRQAVGLASNRPKDRWPRFLDEDIDRLKRILGTDDEPMWYPEYDY
ncbi:unnamed protein product [Somion occarium]|uniref:Uncharacterized protein n=1 Tax=Somion occarium TaxID=3059160 RepID=A0ABP1E0L0_9APHY